MGTFVCVKGSTSWKSNDLKGEEKENLPRRQRSQMEGGVDLGLRQEVRSVVAATDPSCDTQSQHLRNNKVKF